MSDERRRQADPARDAAYSEWHRTPSLERFLPQIDAKRMSMLDLDGIEIDYATNEPVAIIETTESGADQKQARWTKRMAERSNVPAYVVQTVLAPTRNPTQTRWVVLDIERFVVRRLCDGQSRQMTPAEYAAWLLTLRQPARRHAR